MNDKRNGPEWAPLRKYVKTLPIIVTIFDKDDNQIRQEKLDYGKPDDRVWLGKLSAWAWLNGHYVETEKEE